MHRFGNLLRSGCEFCVPCTCACHRDENVLHCVPCCGWCTECEQANRKQIGRKRSDDKKGSVREGS
jgi:hypothetical protein